MKNWLTILYLIIYPALCFSQIGAGSKAPLLQNNSGFSINLYGGLGTTWIKSWFFTPNGIPLSTGVEAATFPARTGYDINLTTRYKTKEGFYMDAGLSYEIQSYKIDAVNTVFYMSDINTRNILNDGNTNYSYIFYNYYLSLPLTAGYLITHKKWEFSAGLGVEFYYNYENKENATATNPVFGQITQQIYFYNGRSPVGSVDGGRWSTLGAYGIIEAETAYKISSRFSINCIPLLRFTNPFAQNPRTSLFITNVRQNTFSLDFGITYGFSSKNEIGGFSQKWDRVSIGFSVVPTYLVNKLDLLYTIPPFGNRKNLRFSYSYAFPLLYDLSGHFKLESGIDIDNFNYIGIMSNVLIGLPVILRYYIPLDEAQHSSLYIGAGCHIDYPTNIGWLYDPAHPFILPLALGKIGYQLTFGGNYYFDANAGYEISFNNVPASGGHFTYYLERNYIIGLPNYLFCTIGIGCKF